METTDILTCWLNSTLGNLEVHLLAQALGCLLEAFVGKYYSWIGWIINIAVQNMSRGWRWGGGPKGYNLQDHGCW